MARNVPTELIVVDADTRRPVIDIDPLTVPTHGTRWVRNDTPGIAGLITAAHAYTAASGRAADIVWSDDVDRSYEGGCNPCARSGRSGFARLVDMTADGDRVTCPTC